MSETTKKWYVLRAVSGKENKVKEYADAEIRTSDLGQYVSQVLIPMEKVWKKHFRRNLPIWIISMAKSKKSMSIWL